MLQFVGDEEDTSHQFGRKFEIEVIPFVDDVEHPFEVDRVFACDFLVLRDGFLCLFFLLVEEAVGLVVVKSVTPKRVTQTSGDYCPPRIVLLDGFYS